jgi:hypothetical protein
MKTTYKLLLLPLLLIINSCISQFLPEISEDRNILVVEGLISDKPGVNSIKLSASVQLGMPSTKRPLSGCEVIISDNLGNNYTFFESEAGTYISDPSVFQGIIGRFYKLHINTKDSFYNKNYQNEVSYINHIYESDPVELKPVPPIDSLYYEKVTLANEDPWTPLQEGCQVYLDTFDPSNTCKFFRWEFSETWEFYDPYAFRYNYGWVSENSHLINVKSTSVYAEDRIRSYPLEFISNQTDRLSVKYSVLVSQYSLNEDEYKYWDKLQNVGQEVGGLYDAIPAYIPGNVSCVDAPAERVLGYFSVSAISTKRLFIKEHFYGIVNQYSEQVCLNDTIFNDAIIPNLNLSAWVLLDHQMPPPRYKIVTYNKGCADITVRGSIIEPDFWHDNGN